jgi:hypothetical protein
MGLRLRLQRLDMGLRICMNGDDGAYRPCCGGWPWPGMSGGWPWPGMLDVVVREAARVQVRHCPQHVVQAPRHDVERGGGPGLRGYGRRGSMKQRTAQLPARKSLNYARGLACWI